MRRLFVGNFDFEHQLVIGAGRTRSKTLARLNAELAATWIPLAADGDFVWFPSMPDEEFLAEIATRNWPRIVPVQDLAEVPSASVLVCWGASNEVRHLQERFGFAVDAPSVDVVRHVNSRVFSHTLEQQWQVGLPGQTLVTSQSEFDTVCSRLTDHKSRWILKAEHGCSGRERIYGTGTALTPAQAGWIYKRLDAGGKLVWEPFVECVCEAGIQLEVRRSGDARLIGVTESDSDPGGRYRGSRLQDASHDPKWHAAVEYGLRAAAAAQRAGYFGPLGVDAMWYRDHTGETCLRPLQDINARWTMGRVALAWDDFVIHRENVNWCHGTTQEHADFIAAASGPRHICLTSPSLLGGAPAHHASWLTFDVERLL